MLWGSTEAAKGPAGPGRVFPPLCTEVLSPPVHGGQSPWVAPPTREALAGYNGLLFSKAGILKTARHAVSFPNSGGNPDQLWLWAFHTLMSLLCLQCPWDHEYSWAGEERMHTHDPVDRSGSLSGKTQKDAPRDLTPSDVFWRAAS